MYHSMFSWDDGLARRKRPPITTTIVKHYQCLAACHVPTEAAGKTKYHTLIGSAQTEQILMPKDGFSREVMLFKPLYKRTR